MTSSTSTAGSGGVLDAAVTAACAALREAVDASGYLATLSAADHCVVLERLALVQRLTEAATYAVADSLAGRDRAELDALGAKSPTDAIARAMGTDHATARRRLSLAASARPDRAAGDGGDHHSPALPQLGAALAAGTISTAVFELAVRTVRSVPARLRRAHVAGIDTALAIGLPGLSHPEAEQLCSALLDRIDPDRADRGFSPEDYEKRRLRWSRHGDGWVTLNGLLDPETGAAFIAAVDHLAAPTAPVPAAQAPLADVDDDGDPLPGGGNPATDAVPDAAPDAVPDPVPDAAPAVRDTRTTDQRRHDALAVLSRAGVANAGTRGGEPPRVIITATQDQVDGVPGAGRAECEQTGPLPHGVLRSVLSKAVVQAVVLSTQGAAATVLALGTSVRCFSPAQRRAVFARDGGCVFGCDTPLARLEGHHVKEWRAGGLTDVDNAVLACPHEHVLVGMGVWEVRMVDGAPQIRPPSSVDPLRRWRWSPRRALRSRAVTLGEQVVMDLDPAPGASDPPQAWRYADPPEAA